MRQESRLNTRTYGAGLPIVYVFRSSSIYTMFMVRVTQRNTETQAKWRLFTVTFVYHRLFFSVDKLSYLRL